LFEALDQLRCLEQRQTLDFFDNTLNLGHCDLLTGNYFGYS
jgi:hypothetical protein